MLKEVAQLKVDDRFEKLVDPSGVVTLSKVRYYEAQMTIDNSKMAGFEERHRNSQNPLHTAEQLSRPDVVSSSFEARP